MSTTCIQYYFRMVFASQLHWSGKWNGHLVVVASFIEGANYIQFLLLFFFLFITVFVGYQCKVSITFCHCEKEFYQLLRLGLWAATPTCPTLAFSLEFMELTHTLNLECWVALKDRSSAIQFLEVNTISTEVST